MTHAVNHLASMAMRLAEILELEAQAAAQAGDALSPGMAETPQDYVDALWGPDGARFAVAQALMGTMDDDVPYGRVPSDLPDYTSQAFDGMYADRVERDERVAVAMSLLVAHEIPLPFLSSAGSVRYTS